MGTAVPPPDAGDDSDEADENVESLGSRLSGRFADVNIDSVMAVRHERQRE